MPPKAPRKTAPKAGPDLSFEIEAGFNDGRIICGVDEVGRGPLAGPVVACAVILPPDGLAEDLMRAINDSKALKKSTREDLAPAIRAHCRVGLGLAGVEEIDRLNILQATLAAMTRAVAELGIDPHLALIDGNKAPKLDCETRTVVGGDGRCLSIAAASIVAKVERDRMMEELAQVFPGYGWDRNAGYGTAEHLAALERLGPTPHHRRSFSPVSKLFALSD
ncbi:MAG TPA: ribonuclease HII [Azospirillaceae bacterium]|nr:ribonuclease HII [Azospirillaceae bacterium]